MVFILPVSRAIAKVEEHCKPILEELAKRHPEKALHEISPSQIIAATNRILTRHPDFEQHAMRVFGIKMWSTGPRKKWYSRYEIGHYLVTRRLFSRLKSEGHLQKEHEELFRTIVGKLHYNPPLSHYKKAKNAFERLTRKLGKKKMAALLLAAREICSRESKEWNDPGRHKLLDIFLNTASVPLFSHSEFIQSTQQGKPIESAREWLADMVKYIEKNPNSAYVED
ncbi:MAG: hypothetical protein Q8R15_03920 [Candidatus Micrarchaeota archaeon]|nr:hypothetical protein [Candidatus Micrarchaeota archaeon]